MTNLQKNKSLPANTNNKYQKLPINQPNKNSFLELYNLIHMQYYPGLRNLI